MSDTTEETLINEFRRAVQDAWNDHAGHKDFLQPQIDVIIPDSPYAEHSIPQKIVEAVCVDIPQAAGFRRFFPTIEIPFSGWCITLRPLKPFVPETTYV